MKHPTTASVPIFWRPESVSNTELVACFSEPYKVDWGTCTYDDGTSFNRYSQRIEISVFIAQTGELLDIISREGPRPSACPEKIVAGGEWSDYVGDDLDGNAPFRQPVGRRKRISAGFETVRNQMDAALRVMRNQGGGKLEGGTRRGTLPHRLQGGAKGS